MRYRVVQNFKTPMHHFVAGSEIDGSEVDGVLTAEHWVELNRLEPVAEHVEHPAAAEVVHSEPAPEAEHE